MGAKGLKVNLAPCGGDLHIASMALGLILSALIFQPGIGVPSSAAMRSISRPDMGAVAMARSRAQSETMLRSHEQARAQADAQEAETRRLQCVSARQKADQPAASCSNR